MDFWPTVEKCAWDLPVFYELLRRGIKWAIEPFDAEAQAAYDAAKKAAAQG